jgi:hypothetical protein
MDKAREQHNVLMDKGREQLTAFGVSCYTSAERQRSMSKIEASTLGHLGNDE